jgi:hypothetical protein
MMKTVKGILAVCLLGAFTSLAHANAACGPGETEETVLRVKSCCKTATKDKTCDKGPLIDCAKKIETSKTCEGVIDRERRLKRELRKK